MAATARPSEDDLIARHFAPLAGPGGLGLRDDAALLVPPDGCDLVVTVDAIVEGVHFLPSDAPESVAAKALAVNLSDLAAKGADPLGYLLALALPDGWTEPWLEAFCRGLARTGAEHGCALLGGDTVRAAGALTLSVTAIGSVPAGRMVRRTTARAGDLVCVTGTIGDAVLGLDLARGARPGWRASLSSPEADELLDRYRRPRPRLAHRELLRSFATSAMDVSDGLLGDLAKLLRVSGVTGAIDAARVPYSAAARAALAAEPALRDRLVTGGDDYELLFTVPAEALAAVMAAAATLPSPVTVIGTVDAGTGALVVLDGGMPVRIEAGSFQHF